jgi:hypothetical protein
MVVLLSFCYVGMAVRSILTVSLVFDAVATMRDALMRLGVVSKSLCTKLWNSVRGVKLRGLKVRGRTGNDEMRGFFAALRMTNVGLATAGRATAAHQAAGTTGNV